LSPAIYQCAIALKQQQKMSLWDALIAATALEYKEPLVTRNTQDFQWISHLSVINPVK
jgi:predicted nucleic acid-binding protein